MTRSVLQLMLYMQEHDRAYCSMCPQVKLAAVYLSMTLLSLIMVILLVRAVIASATWVALGRSLWLFPYLLSEVRGPDAPFYIW